ncbi:hypothetical protein EDB19DRAFT_1911976 [Suillus lakei]|nr:hypothetical protein EDB19DRAFT_1911976 [Suillus lakei]
MALAPPQSSPLVQPPPSSLSVQNQPYHVPSTTPPSPPVISGPSLVTGYAPACQASQLQVTRGHTTFGVPMSGVSITNNSWGHTRGRGRGIVISTPMCALRIQLILIPQDISDEHN